MSSALRSTVAWALALAFLCAAALLRVPEAQAETLPVPEAPAVPPAIAPAVPPAIPPAVPPGGAGGAAPPEGAPAQGELAAPGADRSAPRPFRERVTGQALTVGVSQAQVRLEIQTRAGATIERYTSGSDVTPTLNYYGAPVELMRVRPGSGFDGTWVLDVAGTIGGFGGRQTLQTNPDGSTADGTVSGDYAIFAAGTSLWLVREGATVPLALRLAGNVGVGTVQYRGDLNHTAGNGAAASGTLQNDGTSLQPVGTAGVEFRAAQVSLSARSVQFFDSGDSLLTFNGLPLAKYRHRFRADVYTLGYAVEF